MKRIAIIISGGNIKVRKGLINASISRAIHLQTIADYSIDIFDIQLCTKKITKYSLFHKDSKPDYVEIDGCRVKMIWRTEYYSNIIILKQILSFFNRWLHLQNSDCKCVRKYARFFSDYDMISAHSTEAAFLAQTVKRKYGIPYCATWHGSDIHTSPFQDEERKHITISIIEHADYNFYVSRALLEKSEELTSAGNKCVLYNGLSDGFERYDENRRAEIRDKYGVANDAKVVAFVGTMREIKNDELLPAIFKSIKDQYSGEIVFWIIGDGSQRKEVEIEIVKQQLPCKMWGYQPMSIMPELMNCIDLLILPSKNEGLPLVTLEAIACGANVIGSKVGGIPEVLGDSFCVELGDGFIEQISVKASDLLRNPIRQFVPEKFSWENTAIIEDKIYRTILYGE